MSELYDYNTGGHLIFSLETTLSFISLVTYNLYKIYKRKIQKNNPTKPYI
jgi:hypothetical protein